MTTNDLTFEFVGWITIEADPNVEVLTRQYKLVSVEKLVEQFTRQLDEITPPASTPQRRGYHVSTPPIAELHGG